MKISQAPDDVLDALTVFGALVEESDPLSAALLEGCTATGDLEDDVVDALVVAALRTPSDVQPVPDELEEADLAALEGLSEKLVECIISAVDRRRKRPVLFFSNEKDFEAAFELLIGWRAVGSRVAPFLIEASRPLLPDEVERLHGVRFVDHATELCELPRSVHPQIRAYLEPILPSSPPNEGERWDSSRLPPPDST